MKSLSPARQAFPYGIRNYEARHGIVNAFLPRLGMLADVPQVAMLVQDWNGRYHEFVTWGGRPDREIDTFHVV